MAIKEYKRTDESKLSANFKVSEFKCKCGCSTLKVDEKLIVFLQKIRDHFDAPVRINSAYRCVVHNKRVGGAINSRHTKGQAADIAVENTDPSEVARFAESIGVLGIGLYETDKDGHFVHIDTRGYKSFWYGQSSERRSTFGGYSEAEFVKDVQCVLGAKVDGVAGPETLGKTITVSSSVNNKHGVVKVIQKRLNALGYTQVGKADGIAGAKFTSAVKAFQKDNDCVADGEITAQRSTWCKLLGLK